MKSGLHQHCQRLAPKGQLTVGEMHLMTVSVLIKDRGLNQRAVLKTLKKRKMIRIIKLAGKSRVKLTQSCSLATNHRKAIRTKQTTQARQQSGGTSRVM